MTSIVLHSTGGPDGKLYLEVPVGSPNTEFEVEVVVRPKPPEGQGWPPGYFELFGSIDDETFTVHPQPPWGAVVFIVFSVLARFPDRAPAGPSSAARNHATTSFTPLAVSPLRKGPASKVNVCIGRISANYARRTANQR